MIRTKRLILRAWKPEDLIPFAALNADPKVMEYFPSLLTKEESDRLAQRLQAKIEEKGWGFWAVEVPQVADFIGFIGLNTLDFQVPFTPTIEIGWRLAYPYWGQGYATEGARACLNFAFQTLHLPEIVSFTATQNLRSQSVMKKLGFHHNPSDDFDHPKLAPGHPLRRHVLYRLKASE